MLEVKKAIILLLFEETHREWKQLKRTKYHPILGFTTSHYKFSWDTVNLVRQPSLKMDLQELFFKLIFWFI